MSNIAKLKAELERAIALLDVDWTIGNEIQAARQVGEAKGVLLNCLGDIAYIERAEIRAAADLSEALNIGDGAYRP